MFDEETDPIETEETQEEADAEAPEDPATPDPEGADGDAEATDDAEGEAAPEGDAKAGEEPAEEPKEEAPRRFTLKVDGEEIEKDEKEVIALAQKGLHADRTLFEAKELASLAESLQKAVLEDPMEVTRQLLLGQGYDEDKVEEAAYAYLEKQFAAAFKRKANPEEAKKYRFERETKRIERERAEIQAERERLEKERLEREVSLAKSSFEKEVTGAIGEAGLPETDDIVLAIAEKVRDAEEAGEELSTLDAARIVKREIASRKKDRIPGLTLEELEAEYPEEFAKLMRKHKETLKQRSTTPGTTQAAPAAATKPARRDKAKSRPKTWEEVGFNYWS